MEGKEVREIQRPTPGEVAWGVGGGLRVLERKKSDGANTLSEEGREMTGWDFFKGKE